MEWPFVGRERERQAFLYALRGGKAGIVLAGAAGVGKTRAAQEFALSVSDDEPLLVAATRSSSQIPLGAFATLLDATTRSFDSQTALLAESAAELASISSPVVIDDAHHLDPLSASVVHQALTRRESLSIVTVRTGEDTPPAVTALWKDDLVDRVDIGPLDRRATRKLVQQALGGGIGDNAEAVLWQLSQGHPLYLRYLVDGALEAEAIRLEDGKWRLEQELTPPARLVDLLWDQIERTGTAQALRVLDLARTFEFDLLVELVGMGAVDAAEKHHMIRVEHSDRRVIATASHPLLPEISASRATEVEMRALRAKAAARIEATGMHREADLLRVAQLSLEAGSELPLDTGIAAANAALRLFDPDLAERTICLARQSDDSHAARLLHGQALRFLGRPELAVEVLKEGVDRARNESEVADAVTLAVETLLFSGDPVSARSFADRALNDLSEPQARSRVATKAALVAAVVGDMDRTVDIGESVIQTQGLPAQVRLDVLITVTAAQPLAGRLHEVHERIEEGLRLIESTTPPPLAVHQLTLNRQWAHQCQGQMGRAAEVGLSHWLEVNDSGGPIAGVGMVTADTVFERADFEEVVRIHEKSLAEVSRFDAFANRPHIHFWATTLALQMGLTDLAERWEAEATGDGTDIRVVFRRPRIDAWSAAMTGDLDSAGGYYDQLADAGRKGGCRLWLAFALGDALRLGHPELVVTHLDSLAEGMDGETVRLFSTHAHELLDNDGADLEELSRRYHDLGWVLRSAESAADASRAYRRSGQPEASRRAAVRARSLAEDFCRLTPPLHDIPEGLSKRELEVARLAAVGQSNKQLADRLYLSVRTVENHLARIYRKLSIASRSDLDKIFS